MSVSTEFYTSSIGRKVILSTASIVLTFFLVAHLSGNLLIFIGRDALNSYAAFLKTIPFFLWPIRILTLISFIIHMVFGIVLAQENRRARPKKYQQHKFQIASLASRAMATSGLVLLTYVIYHLLHFTFGYVHSEYYHVSDAVGRHDVYTMVVNSFQNIFISVAYIVSIFAVALHLSHGIPSLFQTIGFRSQKIAVAIQKVGWGFAVIIFFGYSSIPIAIYLGLVTL